MEERRLITTTAKVNVPQLNTANSSPETAFNRLFMVVTTPAILSLIYYHIKTIATATSSTKPLATFSMQLTLLLADLVLTFMWATAQALRFNPIERKEFPERVEKVVNKSEFPNLDVFICTADPYKEPPMSVVNTALSVLAYDYPSEKVSVYVSDDGGSVLTLFALFEAANFARTWLPFCKKNNIVDRCPKAFFDSYSCYNISTSEIEQIKAMYESMKERVENAVKTGKVSEEYITNDTEREAFNKWTPNFTRQNHPSVIQILLDNKKDKDVEGDFMSNFIYVSREKNVNYHHGFKAGALNALIRVSAMMTDAPIILTLDCDMYSNDPSTPLRMLCYYSDPQMRSEYAYIQFPQLFQGINKNDIYGCQFRRLFTIQPKGFDGLGGPNHVGTCSFFSRRAFFGGPSSFVVPEIPDVGPNHVVNKPINDEEILSSAHKVLGCNYEEKTGWGDKMGFKYGSLVEDYYTGYRLQCEGWKAIFCNPDRPAFFGEAPISLIDLLNQQKRWAFGVLQVGFSKYSPLTVGLKAQGPLFALGYSQYAFWPIWVIPILVYAFLPQLALLNNHTIFPKVSEPWFLAYVFVFLVTYGQDYLDFVREKGGTFYMWWNDQRIWTIRGLSCFIFGCIEFFLKSLGISRQGFTLTSKVIDDEQSKRYEQGVFEFGVHSPMFVPLVMAALVNLVSLTFGIGQVVIRDSRDHNWEGMLLQMLISGFGVVNCWPVYEAILLRSDNGKLPLNTLVIATLFSWALYVCGIVIFYLL